MNEIRENSKQIRHTYKAKIRRYLKNKLTIYLKTHIYDFKTRRFSKTTKTYETNKIDDSSTDEIKLIQTVNIESTTENMTNFRVKYLHFDPKVYRRPPYYGTWKKRSKIINPRNPFAKDDVKNLII